MITKTSAQREGQSQRQDRASETKEKQLLKTYMQVQVKGEKRRVLVALDTHTATALTWQMPSLRTDSGNLVNQRA